MNIENMRELADIIESAPDSLYDQTSLGRIWYNTQGEPCGSAGCLMGWLSANGHEYGSNYLSLNEEEVWLFSAYWPTSWLGKYCTGEPKLIIEIGGLFSPTRKQSVQVLRAFADLGYVPGI